ncbi:MAG: DUF5683 domain-containing protein [Cyclobacteriaceae bacterium]|nr:DUF5683 domain-containing protein [Cyclobacteriaceae bacterium]
MENQLKNPELNGVHIKKYDPRIAGLYSAVLPGLGQAYNKKYLKIPLIYVGFIGLYYQVNRYNNDYQTHRKGLLYAVSNNSFADATATYAINGREFTEVNLRNRVNNSRRERDYWIIIGSVFYLLNIVDAHIDAHLREFDVNEKLKLTVDPSLSQSLNSMQAGFSFTLHFQ